MDRIPVSSTDLASVGYDVESSVLEVEFHKSGIYQYFGVAADVHDQLISASSKGRYFNEVIKKGGYSFAKVG